MKLSIYAAKREEFIRRIGKLLELPTHRNPQTRELLQLSAIADTLEAQSKKVKSQATQIRKLKKQLKEATGGGSN